MGLIYNWCNYWTNIIYEEQYHNQDTYNIQDLVWFTICLPFTLCLVGIFRLYRKINELIMIVKDYINSIEFRKG